MTDDRTLGCGSFATIVGPPPEAPLYTLLGAARIIEDVDSEGVDRWGNGVKVYPYPIGGQVIDGMAVGTYAVKDDGDDLPSPEFGAIVVYVAETCSTQGIWGAGLSPEEAQSRFAARAQAVLGSVESSLVAREFMAGDVVGLNPHLADGNGTFPNNDGITNLANGLALLENEIAVSGRQGLIHLSPGAALAADRLIHEDSRSGKLRTINGTVVVPDAGYLPSGLAPPTHAAPADTRHEWIYATGPVEARRSEVVLLPDTVGAALDRATNTITYRAERYYVVDWDTVVQASVLIDRCATGCGDLS